MKKWYASKTLWVNLLFMVIFIAQHVFGFVLEPAIQIQLEGAVLIFINVILRIVTKEEIIW